MNLRLKIITATLCAVSAAQTCLLWWSLDRSSRLAQLLQDEIANTDRSIELAETWKEIANRWHFYFEQESDRCPATKGRAL
jgi:hypothetical protein